MATETGETWNRSIFFSLRTLMHLIAAASITFGLYYDFNYVFPPPDHSHYEPLKSFGKFGKFRFLTVLNAVCMLSFTRFISSNLHNSKHNPLKMICWTKFIDFFCISQIWQAVYFTLCIVNDFIGTNEFHPKRPSALRKLKDYVFAAFAFPLALNVAISFWSIYAVDRELILPKSFDSFFPV